MELRNCTASPTVRTDGISEFEGTVTEEETEAQREGTDVFWGWFLFACFPRAFPGGSWVLRGLIAGPGPSPTLLSAASPLLSA